MRRIDWLAVTALLLFAAGLRIIGIGYGRLNPEYFPSYAPFGMVHEQLPIQPDEFFNVAIPVNMALRNHLNPEFFNYPSFIINTNYVVFRLTRSLNGLSLADRDGYSLRAYADFALYVIARSYSVLGSMLIVACGYAIARIVAGRFAALCAGLIIATSFTLVQYAHYIKPASLATGWMMLTTWACIASLHSRRCRERRLLYILAGVMTGLAATTRYNALAVAPITLSTGLILLYRHRIAGMRTAVVIAWLLIPLVFFLCSPYILRDFEHFRQDLSSIVGQYVSGIDVPDYFQVDHWTGMTYVLAYIPVFALGITAVFFSGFSLVAAWKARPRGNWLSNNSIALFVVLFFATIALYAVVALRTVRPGHTDHHLLLVLPFVALLSAIGADWLVRRLSLPTRITMPIVALALVIQPLVLSLQVVEMFAQPDTRHIMLQWIHDYIPPGSRFFLNGPYNVPLDEAIYPSEQQFVSYATTLPDAADYEFMVYSDALAFDILRSKAIVPADVVVEQQDYLRLLDETYDRIAEIRRPSWTGSEAMMNMAAYWHNPTLILYCVNPARCEAGR